MAAHPIQPLKKDGHGTIRFKKNAIVRFLLDEGPFDLNIIAVKDFAQEDREQFAQLIGYSLSGFGELSYVRSDTYDAAATMAERGVSEDAARIAMLEEKVAIVRTAFRELIPELFHIHPDDLTE